MKVKTPAGGPIEALYVAAKSIVDNTRKVFSDHGEDATELRLPILMHGADMRVTIEAGPKVAARNAIEEAQCKASGSGDLGPRLDMTAVINEAKALLASYAAEVHDRIEASDHDHDQADEKIMQRCLATAKGLFDVERLL
jgi:hypothetical protein